MEVLEFEATSFTWEENTNLRSLTLAGSEQVTLTLEADSPNGLHFEINGQGAHQAVESFRLSAAALECFLHPSPTLPPQVRIKLTSLPIAKITELASHLQLLTVD